MYRPLIALLLVLATAAVAESRISATGRLEIETLGDTGGWVLHTSDADYRLEFAARAVRDFAAEMNGQIVTVHGALRVARANGDTRMTIAADTIVNPVSRAAVAVGTDSAPPRPRKPRLPPREEPGLYDEVVETETTETSEPINTTYETTTEECPTPAPVSVTRTRRTRVSRSDRANVARDEYQPSAVLDLDYRYRRRFNPYLGRGARRNAEVLSNEGPRDYGPDVIMLPGGGAIIKNNNW